MRAIPDCREKICISVSSLDGQRLVQKVILYAIMRRTFFLILVPHLLLTEDLKPVLLFLIQL